jgi:hypothetical protein
MCVACLEYTKDRLNVNELKGALRETTVNDRAHLEEVERLIREHAGKPDELKEKLRQLNQRK